MTASGTATVSYTTSCRGKQVIVRPFEQSTKDALLKLMEKRLQEDQDSCYEVLNSMFPGKMLRCGVTLSLGRSSLKVVKRLGKGGYGVVFKVCEIDASVDGVDVDLAMKVQASCAWDMFISREIEHRTRGKQRQWFCCCQRGVQYVDKGVTIMPRGGQTLQYLLNAYNRRGKHMHELTAMAFTIELLKIVECLHQHDILHLDIKLDNLLLREQHHHPLQGLLIIDFGRSIDLRLLPPKCVFEGNSEWCTAPLGVQTWCYEPDRYSVACAAHFLLWGTMLPFDTRTSVPTTTVRMKRYWQSSLWQPVFAELLTSPGPVNAAIRQPLEAHLASKTDLLVSEMAQHKWMI